MLQFVPLVGSLRESLVQEQILTVLIQPVAQARPTPDERLVCDLDKLFLASCRLTRSPPNAHPPAFLTRAMVWVGSLARWQEFLQIDPSARITIYLGSSLFVQAGEAR